MGPWLVVSLQLFYACAPPYCLNILSDPTRSLHSRDDSPSLDTSCITSDSLENKYITFLLYIRIYVYMYPVLQIFLSVLSYGRRTHSLQFCT